MLQDTLEFRKKQRVIKVRMLDGSVKSIVIDDSHIVEQLMVTICLKIGKLFHLSQIITFLAWSWFSLQKIAKNLNYLSVMYYFTKYVLDVEADIIFSLSFIV